MKIGFICHNAFPIAQPFQGGLEMITYLLVHELVVRGHEVVSLCLRDSELAGKMEYYSIIDDFDEDLNEELKSLGSVSYSLNNFLEQDFDVVQNHSLHYQSILLGNLSKHTFVTTFHTPIFPYLNLGIKAIANNVNQKFVGVSNCISELYEESLPKVFTIYNGIDISLWAYEYNELDDYYSWSGRICKEKGLAQVMGLCLQNNINLKIAGPISNCTYFETQIEPLLELDNFEYLGHLKQKELNGMVKHSKGFIFSSIWEEPYGLVIAEALACGVPVLANAVGAAPEIIDAVSGCLFNINDPSTFNLGLGTLNNLSRRDCRARAEKFCSHHNMVSKYEELYASVSNAYLEKVS